MTADYAFVLIDSKEKLLPYKDAILKLFTICFGFPLDPRIWDWAYIGNPCGDPFICLAIHEGEVVGHYTGIPQPYVKRDARARFVLSMTIMVHPKHRAPGVFRDSAEATYREAAARGIAGVLGFPNKQSTPGFRKRLAWNIDKAAAIRRFDLAGFSSTAPSRLEPIDETEFVKRFSPGDAFQLDLGDPAFLSWRLHKPGKSYSLAKLGDEALFVFQPYGNELDVLYMSRMEPEIFARAAAYAKENGRAGLNILGAANLGSELSSSEKDYAFGWRSFTPDQYSFSLNMLMSDIF